MALSIGDIVTLARAGYKLNDIKALQESETEEPPKEEPPKEESEELKALRTENEALKKQINKMQKDNVDSDVHKEEQTTSLSDIIRTYM